MKHIWSSMQLSLAGIGGWLGYILGGFDGFVYALVSFVVIDYITGFMCAVLVDKKLSSEVGFKGIYKKVLIFMMVAVGNIADDILIGDSEIIRTAVIFFYLSNEGISLLENVGKIGLPIPEKLKEILVQLHDGGDNNVNK